MKLNQAETQMLKAIATNVGNRVEGIIDHETRPDETTILFNEAVQGKSDEITLKSLIKKELVLCVERNIHEDEVRLTDNGLFIYNTFIARRTA